MLKRGASVLIRLFSSSSASASLRTTVVSSRTMRPTITPMRVPLVVLVEVARDALLQVARLADVQHLVRRRRRSGTRPAATAGRPLRRAAIRARGRRRFSAHRSSIIGVAPRQCARALGPLLPRDRQPRRRRRLLAAGGRPRGARRSGAPGDRRRDAAGTHGARRRDRASRCVAWRDDLAPGADTDVAIEAFGCDPPARYVEQMARRGRPPCWINLEYLSAEPHVGAFARPAVAAVERAGPGPGEVVLPPGLHARHRRPAARARPARRTRRVRARRAGCRRMGWPRGAGERVVVLFCYPHPGIGAWLQALSAQPTLLLVPQGPAQTHRAARTRLRRCG